MLKNFIRFIGRILIISQSLFGFNSLFSQSFSKDSNADSLKTKRAIDLYYQSIAENNHLNSGTEFVAPFYREDMNPFYQTILFSNGNVLYDDVWYHDVPLMYDIMHDQLITKRYQINTTLLLAKIKVSAFTFLGHDFIMLTRDSINKLGVNTGFYDQLYMGKLKVYAKRSKKREENLRYNELVVRILENDLFYIKKGDVYNLVKNKKTLFAVFGDRKNDIRKYLRKSKIRFGENPENAIVKSAEYYDQIQN
jgi:hypothetical protein